MSFFPGFLAPVLHYLVDPKSPLADAATIPDLILHIIAGILRLFGFSV